jgi:hypothetical protein
MGQIFDSNYEKADFLKDLNLIKGSTQNFAKMGKTSNYQDLFSPFENNTITSQQVLIPCKALPPQNI